MKWLKGMALLLIANVLIFITLSISFNLLVNVILPAFGVDVRGAVDQQDLLWAIVLGFGGAFISLAFSKQMARMMLDCHQITQPRIRLNRSSMAPFRRSRNGFIWRCPKSGSMTPPIRTPSRPVPARIIRWWLSPPAC